MIRPGAAGTGRPTVAFDLYTEIGRETGPTW